MDEQIRLERRWRALSGTGKRLPPTRILHGLCTLFVLTSFLPYPGLAIGDNTGLEVHDALTLALIPVVLILGVSRRHLTVFMLFLVPAAISASAAAAAGRIESLNVAVASLMGITLGFSALLPNGMFAKAEYLPNILRGVCIALFIHVAAGAYQVYAFSRGQFPFLAILRNPSYMDLSSQAEKWVLYIQRPFGLFPEPSAMAASIGPWLVVTTGLLLYPQLLPYRQSRGTRFLLLLATAGGVWLIIWSRSGFVAPMILVLGVISLPRARQAASQFFIIRRLMFILLAVAVVWMMVIFARTQFGHRLETANSADPWEDRRSSLEIGIRVPNTGTTNLLLGVGPGQATLILQETEGLDTVWSLTIRDYAETGLLGLFCMLTIAAMIARAIFRSSARLIGTCAALTWLFGITFVTSYGMTAIWLFLAVLISWDHIFPAATVQVWMPKRIQVLPMRFEGIQP